MNSYIVLLNVLQLFAESHMQIQRFGAEFVEQLQNFASEDEKYPLLYVVPISQSSTKYTKTFTVDIYCVDLLQKDRDNSMSIISDTQLILNDLFIWFTDGKLPIEIEGTPAITPLNNALLDFCAGNVMQITFITDNTTICDIPFDGIPVITSETCDIHYDKALTCDTLIDCPVIIEFDERITALESGTSGISGTSGSSGTSGLDGAQGSSGLSGQDGSSGSSGLNGSNGSSGSSGLNGSSGSSGSSGLSGSSGVDGNFYGGSGTSGINGLNGTSGSQWYGEIWASLNSINIATIVYAPLDELGPINGFTYDLTNFTLTPSHSGTYLMNFSGLIQTYTTTVDVPNVLIFEFYNIDDNNGPTLPYIYDITNTSKDVHYASSQIVNLIAGKRYAIRLYRGSNNTIINATFVDVHLSLTSIGGIDGTSGSSGINGSSGSSGLNGTQGIQGIAGSSGSSGINGLNGTSGISIAGTSGSSGISIAGTSGSSGLNGTSGSSGFSGSSGSSGFSGSSGSSGLTGTSGSSGLNGTSGSSGFSGSSGSSGFSGSSGSSGSTGTSGSSGLAGTSGSSGINGAQGIQGIQGPAGLNGTSGSSGLTGTSGSSGSIGLTGTSGSSGLTGSNGLDGTSGLTGTSGTSGVSGGGATEYIIASGSIANDGVLAKVVGNNLQEMQGYTSTVVNARSMATDGTIYVKFEGGAIWSATSYNGTWTQRVSSISSTYSIIYCNGYFLYPAGAGGLHYSTNGTTWAVRTLANLGSLSTACHAAWYDGTTFYVVGGAANTQVIKTASTITGTWTTRLSGAASGFMPFSICGRSTYMLMLCYATGADSVPNYSVSTNDGVTWSAIAALPSPLNIVNEDTNTPHFTYNIAKNKFTLITTPANIKTATVSLINYNVFSTVSTNIVQFTTAELGNATVNWGSMASAYNTTLDVQYMFSFYSAFMVVYTYATNTFYAYSKVPTIYTSNSLNPGFVVI